MRRREFITLVGGAAAAWPLAAFGKTPRIAIVLPSFPVSKMTETGNLEFKAFFNELGRLGYVEGANLIIERYSGEGRAAHYADLAREVVSRNPDVICQTERTSNPPADQIRTDHKSKNGQGAWPHRARHAACGRRRGDRVSLGPDVAPCAAIHSCPAL
jgi:hypothetical protein